MTELELPDDVARRLQKEAGVMSGLRHPHLVTFLGLSTMPPCILTGASAPRSCAEPLSLLLPHATPARAAAHAAKVQGVVLLRRKAVHASPLSWAQGRVSLCHPAVWTLYAEWTSMRRPRRLPAEYCSRGSLLTVLRRASRDPVQAAELTWKLRLRMVGWGGGGPSH